MWSLQQEENSRRLYVNSATGSKCEMDLIKVDRDGNKWFAFNNLLTMPYTRHFAAQKISSLYSLGLNRDDINTHISGLKTILKSSDPEKYEKAFSNVLDFESKASNATDPVKQMSSLVCVYYCFNDESIDSFENNLQLKKMSILENDHELHNFFLTHQINLIESFTNRLGNLSAMSLVQLPEV